MFRSGSVNISIRFPVSGHAFASLRRGMMGRCTRNAFTQQGGEYMKAVITVLGSDRIGIIAGVTAILAETGVNILDISQTIMQDIFTMIMMVDLTTMTTDFGALQERLTGKGREMGVEIRVQRDDIFRSMHRI